MPKRVEAERARASVLRRRFVIDTFPEGGVGAEVGVWRGDFSEAVLEHAKPRLFHLIDPWQFHEDPGFARARFSGRSATDQKKVDEVFESVRSRFASELGRGVVVIHRETSDTALRDLADGSLDWIYIDGNHRYEYVKDELARSLDLVRPGGVIAGDDYANPGWWDDGVTRAVDEFVAAGHAAVVEIRDHQFVLRRPEDAAHERALTQSVT
jgi:hypothetical protein